MTSSFKLFNHYLKPLCICRLLSLQHHSALPFRAHTSLSAALRTSPRFSFSHSRFLSVSSPSTLMDVVIAAARQGSATGESVAIRADQKNYSYSQLISSARKISSLLCNGGIKPAPSDVIGAGHLGGARIGIVAKPSAEFVAGVLGTWLSGGVAVPLALSYPEAELLHVMSDSDVAMVLSTEDHSESLENIAAKSDAQFSLIPTVPSNFSHTDTNDSLPDEADSVKSLVGNFQTLSKVEGDDPALIVYTSGTTGKPKGVVHTHKSINAQVKILSEAWEYTSSDQFLHSLPLHHVHGLFNALFAPLYAGSTVEFIPKFSVRGIWQRFRESYPTDGKKADDAITVFTGVPTMYTRLIQGYDAMDPDLQRTSASAAANLRLMMCGSSAMPYPVMKRWETITGHRLLERYGMTEFVMAIANPLRGERKPGTVGKPFPGVEVKILADTESGDDATGVGELCVRSPSLFKEYWKLPEVTKDSFIDGGFFKTGDTVRVDEDGYYIILGRTSADIMKVGGYKLSALDIESVLLEHPVIAECSVFGLPDKDYGEAVCVVVVPEADAKRKQEAEQKPAITLEELCAWAKDRLAPYKLPSKLFLWDSVPRNAMGKVNKKELKKMLAEKEQ